MKEKRIAVGNTAEVFEIDRNRVLKLFKRGYTKQDVMREYENGQLIMSLNMSAPKLYSMVEAKGRFGYIMEYIHGCSLYDMLLEEGTFMTAMEIFTDCHKKWLSNVSEKPLSYKAWLNGCLYGKNPPDELRRAIDALPEGRVLCHGDFHPLNIMLKDKEKPVVMDFANVCIAPKEYDIARTYLLLKEALPEHPISDIYLQMMGEDMSKLKLYYEVLGSVRRYEGMEQTI